MVPALLLALAATFVPMIDMQRSCHGEERGLPSEEHASAYHTCMCAEQCALKQLKGRWSTFPAAARRPCAALAHEFDNYVELLVCIEVRMQIKCGTHCDPIPLPRCDNDTPRAP
jgi:hypothetical protein